MSEYKNFTRTDLENGYIICDDVHLPSKNVCKIFLSDTGAYVLSQGPGRPTDCFRELSDILDVSRLRLYLIDDGDGITGLYDPEEDMLCCQLDDDSLTEDLNAWLSEGRSTYDKAALERIIARIQSADIKGRGYYVQDDEVLLLRHGKLYKASPISSDGHFFLTLFFGVPGFHRFALGKFMSGMLYLFTGGFFLVGWLFDVLQLLLGIQKDSKKRYLFPLKNRMAKLAILPLGILVGVATFLLYVTVTEMFATGLSDFLAHEVQNADPKTLQSLMDLITTQFSE